MDIPVLNATFRELNNEQEKLFESIPHGSGIDNRWIIEKKKGYWRCFNSYHAMNEHGYYEGYADFTVIIPFKDPEKFRLHFHGNYSQQLNSKHCLREYLEETMHYWISEEFKKKLCPICGERIKIEGKANGGRLIGSCGDAFTEEQWKS